MVHSPVEHTKQHSRKALLAMLQGLRVSGGETHVQAPWMGDSRRGLLNKAHPSHGRGCQGASLPSCSGQCTVTNAAATAGTWLAGVMHVWGAAWLVELGCVQ